MNEDQKTGIVTGGNSGIGEAIVRSLASQGMNLIVAGRRQEENERVAKAVEREFGITALPFSVDVSREEDCLSLFEKADHEFGRLDLLVNNAGVLGRGKIVETETSDFDRVLRTNLYSAYWCSREAYRAMLKNELSREHGLRGSIINISSVCGLDSWEGVGLYGTSKHGMMGLTRSLAAEGAEDGIRVAAVCPAMVSTPMTEVSGPDYITPEDIAGTVAYLLSLSPAAWTREIVVNRRGAG